MRVKHDYPVTAQGLVALKMSQGGMTVDDVLRFFEDQECLNINNNHLREGAHTLLRQLQDKGLAEHTSWWTPKVGDKGRPRKIYALTCKGWEYVDCIRRLVGIDADGRGGG